MHKGMAILKGSLRTRTSVLMQNKTTLYLKFIPIHISRINLIDAVKPTPRFLSLSMSELLKTQDFIRYWWITYDTDENLPKK